MLSQYTIGGPDHAAQELQEFVELTNRLEKALIRVCGEHNAAVSLLEQHGIQTRLSTDLELAGVTVDLFSDLATLRYYLEDERTEAEVHEGKARKAEAQEGKGV